MCEDKQKSKNNERWSRSDIISALNFVLSAVIAVGAVLGYFLITKNLTAVQLASGVTQFISDIQPKFNFKPTPGDPNKYLEATYDSNTLNLKMTLINTGKHRIIIQNSPEVTFSTFKLDDMVQKVALLPKNSYSIQDVSLYGGINDGDTGTGYVKIKFTEIPKSRVYGRIRFTAIIQPEVKKAARKLLIDILEPNDIDNLTLRWSEMAFDFNAQ